MIDVDKSLQSTQATAQTISKKNEAWKMYEVDYESGRWSENNLSCERENIYTPNTLTASPLSNSLVIKRQT